MLRSFTGMCIALGCAIASPAAIADPEWVLYKQRYLDAQGRIVDSANGGISHSESQGIGLLLAVHNKDRATFDKIWRWTQANLQVRNDKLFAWKWTPTDAGASGGNVEDRNNATDGDLLIAWALARAGRQWREASYLRLAREISRDVRAKLVGESAYGTFLLPGEQGFLRDGAPIVNLSYWVFPALQAMSRLDPAPEWPRLIATGLQLLQTARFGRWQLPSDWLMLADKPVLAPGFPPRFGYDALRIPLYLIWARLDNPANLKPFTDFWGSFPDSFLPAWSALNDDSTDTTGALPGVHAVAALTRIRATARSKARPPLKLPALGAQDDYYSASLLLLAKLAASESGTR
jgi:endoglucanase